MMRKGGKKRGKPEPGVFIRWEEDIGKGTCGSACPLLSDRVLFAPANAWHKKGGKNKQAEKEGHVDVEVP